MKPTHCKLKTFSASGYSGDSEALNVRARLKSFSIQTTDNTELNGQYVSFRNGSSTGAILLKWEFGIGTSGTNSANLYVFNCTLPGNGILFPDGIYVDFTLLTEDDWFVNMVYQA